jgi:Tfp pilus assembly protein PilF
VLEAKALGHPPVPTFLLNNYGNALAKCGRPAEALQAFEAAAQQAQATGEAALAQTALANAQAVRGRLN